MRMTHKQKVKLARKLITRAEIKRGTPLFTSINWQIRKYARRIKQRKQYHAALKRHQAPAPAKVEVKQKKKSWWQRILAAIGLWKNA